MKKNLRRIFLLRMVSPLFKNRIHPHGHRYPYMLKYMEALLKEAGEYDVTLLDMLICPMDLSRLLKDCSNWNPDMVVIYSTTRDYEATLEFASQIKKNAKMVIVGVGQDVTARPKEYIFEGSPIDMVLKGDAEVELLNVLRQLNQGKPLEAMRERYLNENALIVSQLDDLPFPGYTREELTKYYHIYPIKTHKRLVWGHIISSRGCPYPCMFCTEMIRETTGNTVRLRSAENVVDEMACLRGKGANIILFDDDNFTTSKKHVEGICNEIIKKNLNIKWVAHSRVDNVTWGLLKLMREAGCVLLRFGIESASERVLKVLDKGEVAGWARQAQEVFGYCQNLGIGTVALFMIGSPTETKEEIEESIQLAKQLDPDVIQVSFFTFYPDTKAWRQSALATGEFEFSKMYHFSAPASRLNLSKMDEQMLNRMQKLFYRTILFNPKYLIKHVLRYGAFYLANPRISCSLLRIGSYLTGSGNGGWGHQIRESKAPESPKAP